tara:strand:+ start:495 stop:782 length:288 start_codon:yes stop_codon:yes gene_type:complete
MKYFIVSYAHQKGFGRRLFGRDGPISEDVIFQWETSCAEDFPDDRVCIIAISEIDGPITPKEPMVQIVDSQNRGQSVPLSRLIADMMRAVREADQ